MTRIAIIAALPGELKPLTRGWQHQRVNGVDLWRKHSANRKWIAACAGAGVDQAVRAFAAVEEGGSVDAVLSIGWAGALTAEFLPGQAYLVSAVLDQRTGERFSTEKSAEKCLLVTSSRVADADEKRRLTLSYGAALVDMEAAGIARLARMRGIPFYSIKGVSDGYDDQLPDFNRFISPVGQFRMVRFVLYVLCRPWYWRALMRMGENSKCSAQAMAAAVENLVKNLIQEQGFTSAPNGNSDGRD